MDQHEIRRAVESLHTLPDDHHDNVTMCWTAPYDRLNGSGMQPPIDDLMPSGPVYANRRGRRTKRRSQRRRVWKRGRTAMLNGEERMPQPGEYIIVVSPWWQRKWMDYYNIGREL